MTPERWQELKKVLGAVLELDPAERSAYLDRACPEPSVRSEVESLIAAHDKGDSRFLVQPSVELKPGTKLGPYEIVALAGAGGMGEVYRARDTRLNRIVAIKVLPAHAADRDSVRERFEREAQAISSLNRPHICSAGRASARINARYVPEKHISAAAERSQAAEFRAQPFV